MTIGKESEKIEFKESLSELDAGLKSISSMLNRNKEATLFFGVKDNGDIIGIDIAKDTIIKIKEKMKAKIKPMVIPEIDELKTDDGKEYIKVYVKESNIPYSYDGRYYVRTGASDDKVDPHLLVSMVESTIADRIKNIKSPLKDLTFNFVINKLNNMGVHIESLESFCDSYNLRTENNDLNMTAFLLSDQNNINIRVIRFDGLDKVNMLERKDFSNQSILKSFEECMDYLNLFNRNRIIDMKKAERKEIELFNEPALREAVINAFVHNDWKNQVPPTIFMFDNRIEVFSYGELPYGLTLDKFFGGYSKPINDALFRIFMLCRYAEQSGHGVPTIKRKYGEKAFNIDGGFFVVTIPYSFSIGNREGVATPTTPTTPASIKSNIDDTKKRILELIQNDESITKEEIGKKLDMTKDGVKYHIKKLTEEGYIKYIGNSLTGNWVILKHFNK